MYHLLAQQNNPLDPKVSIAMEAISICEKQFGVRAELDIMLKYLDEVPEDVNKKGMIAPGSLARRRLNPSFSLYDLK